MRQYIDHFLFEESLYLYLPQKYFDNFAKSIDLASNNIHFRKIGNHQTNKKGSSYTIYEQNPFFPSGVNTIYEYMFSPGSIKLSKENIYLSRADVISYTPSIAIKSKQGTILINKKIFVTGNEIQTFARIKNIGETPTSILMGFSAVTKEHVKLDHRNFPFKKTNKVIKVVSSKQGSDQIIVDSFTEWTKGCLLAINAQDDLSDLPNNSFVEGAIKEIKQTSDGQAIITLDKPLSKALQKGDKLRVHGCPGSYFYTNKEKLLPGHEISLSSKSIKDDTVLDFSSTAFPKGTFYVVPLLLSYSVNPDTENTIVISDYSIAY